MPPAVAIIASAAIAAAGASIAGATFAAVAGVFLLNTALGFGSMLLAPKPKKPNFDLPSFQAEAAQRTVTVNQAIKNWEMVVGEVRKGGSIIFHGNTDATVAGSTIKDGYIWLVVVYADHEIAGFTEHFLNGEPLGPLDVNGDTQSGSFFYWQTPVQRPLVRVWEHLGTASQAASPGVMSAFAEWTAAHQIKGHAYAVYRIEMSPEWLPNGIPNPTALIRGATFDDPRDSVTRYSNNAAIAARGYMLKTQIGPAASVTEIDSAFAIAAANICDEIVPTLSLATLVTGVDVTDDALDLDGKRLLYARGDRVRISSTGTVPAGLASATDYYVIPRRPRISASKTAPFTPSIQLAASMADALAGMAITITDAGTGSHTITKTGEPRYTADGVIDSGKEPQTIIEELLSGMAGRMVDSGGVYRFIAGAWVAPTIAFDEGDLDGPISETTKHSRRERFNAVKGTYVSHLNDWQPADYPAFISAAFKAEDNNIEIFGDLDLPFTGRSQMAERLAKIALERHRHQETLDVSWNLSGALIQAGDTVSVTHANLDYTTEPFEVAEWSLMLREDAAGRPYLGTAATLLGTASTVFDFDQLTEEIQPVVQDAPDPVVPEAPPDVSSLSAQQNANVVTFKWPQVVDPDLSGYELRYTEQGIFAWENGIVITKATRGTLVTNAALPPGSWTVGIKAVKFTDLLSANAATANVSVVNQNDIVLSRDEHPRWAGTLTGFVKHAPSGRLVPDSLNLANADGWETFDQFVVNPVAQAIYEAVEMDLGFDATDVRFWASVEAGLGPDAIGAADPQFEIDFRLAAASYDGFEPWTIGSINARYIKSRVSIDTTTGIAWLGKMTPTADTPERQEKSENVTVPIGGLSITFVQAFNLAPNVQTTPDGGAAVFPVKSAVTKTGFTIKVFDAAGVDVGGVVDWIATGP